MVLTIKNCHRQFFIWILHATPPNLNVQRCKLFFLLQKIHGRVEGISQQKHDQNKTYHAEEKDNDNI